MNEQKQHTQKPKPRPDAGDDPFAGADKLEAARAMQEKLHAAVKTKLAQVATGNAQEELDKRQQRGGE